MKGKKVIHWGGPGGMGGLSKLLLGSNLGIYLDILAMTALLCLLLVLDA